MVDSELISGTIATNRCCGGCGGDEVVVLVKL